MEIRDTIVMEQKILCGATMEDAFEEDSIIVVINNTKSKELKSYTENDFSEVSPVSVENLTIHTTRRIELQRSRNDKDNRMEIKGATSDEEGVDENAFHQILKINLGAKSKQNVLKSIVSFTDDNQYILADVNFDGDVDIKDSTLIQYYVGGHIDEFGE